ncbi:SAV_915 family protein [Streptomyces sp. XH2]|uniref:SAV_915 family protein n=1 Tax=Streptomyces sp. XH2 TaxID=3412483 RepID=UPI003C7DD75B
MEPRQGVGAQYTPVGRLFVPVRPRPRGYLIRIFQAAPGGRTVVGFTSRARLATALGDGHACVELAEPMLRALAEPLGVMRLTVDPHLVGAPFPAGNSVPRAWGRLPLEA